MNKRQIGFILGLAMLGLAGIIYYKARPYYQAAAKRKKQHQDFINEIPSLDKIE